MDTRTRLMSSAIYWRWTKAQLIEWLISHGTYPEPCRPRALVRSRRSAVIRDRQGNDSAGLSA